MSTNTSSLVPPRFRIIRLFTSCIPCFPRRPRRTASGVTELMHDSSSQSITQSTSPVSRSAKPAPPAPAPVVAPPPPPSQPSPVPTSSSSNTNTNRSVSHPAPTANGNHASAQKTKKKTDAPVDPALMYESLKSRIAALEEEEVIEEEEERRFSTCVRSVPIMPSSSL